MGRTVAEVATVAVADPLEAQSRDGNTVPGHALSEDEKSAIRAWLAHIEETNPDEIAAVMDACQNDSGVKNYFLLRAQEVPKHDNGEDDRRHCTTCVNLTKQGQCLAAKRGEIPSANRYYPDDHIPRRCNGYIPGPDDPDRRLGRDRWPNLDDSEYCNANE